MREWECKTSGWMKSCMEMAKNNANKKLEPKNKIKNQYARHWVETVAILDYNQ